MRPFDLSVFDGPLRVPELEGDGVHLRAFRTSDLALVREASHDPFIPSISSIPRRYSDDEGRAFIERQHERAEGGHGFPFVIARAGEPGHGVGAIGLWLREIDSGRASLGYWVVPGARGANLAAAALRRVVAFAFGELAIPRLHLFVEPWNVASIRTAEAAGFEREALLRGWERVEGTQRDAYCFVRLLEEAAP